MTPPTLDLRTTRRYRIRGTVQAVLLVLGLALLLGACAWLLFGPTGFVWVAVAVLVGAAARPNVPAGALLRAMGARPLPHGAVPVIDRAVPVLAQRAGLPRPPAVYYVPTPILNAFAMGTGEGAVLGVTAGLLQHLTARQLVGVLAHEISHIRADDLKVVQLAASLAGLTRMLAMLGAFLFLLGWPLLLGGGAEVLLVGLLLMSAPTLAALLQLALSRTREYDADLDAATLTGDPEGLAQALVVLERQQGRTWEQVMAPGPRMPDPVAVRTHPPTEARVERLLSLRPRRLPPLHGPDEVVVPPGGIDPLAVRTLRRFLLPPGW